MAATIHSILQTSESTSFSDVADRVIRRLDEEEIGAVGEQRTLRRRVYDVLNVFCATGLVVKDSKTIRYLPMVSGGRSSEIAQQIRERLVFKEKILLEKTKLFLGHQLLIQRNRDRERLGTATQLPAIFVAFGDLGDGHVQRALDGKRLEIIAHSAPRFFSPMDLFDKFRFPMEEQVKLLRENPRLREIEALIFPGGERKREPKSEEKLRKWKA
jgi:hypothetical protein